jgi:hypothetical protein
MDLMHLFTRLQCSTTSVIFWNLLLHHAEGLKLLVSKAKLLPLPAHCHFRHGHSGEIAALSSAKAYVLFDAGDHINSH